jgi:hypothetical protein
MKSPTIQEIAIQQEALANIVLIGRKPVLFGAIEFDPAIASVFTICRSP